MAHYRGSSNTRDFSAGFRRATEAAVEEYKKSSEYQTWLAGSPDGPKRLKVAEMYVEVRNPIHDYIVVLET
jgi:hypothetical protein